MSWVLQAHGHVDRDEIDQKVWGKLEDELATALHKVLSDARFGTQHSVLGLRLVQGPIHKEGEPLPKGVPDDGNDAQGNPVGQSAFAGPEQLQQQAAAQAEAAKAAQDAAAAKDAQQ